MRWRTWVAVVGLEVDIGGWVVEARVVRIPWIASRPVVASGIMVTKWHPRSWTKTIGMRKVWRQVTRIPGGVGGESQTWDRGGEALTHGDEGLHFVDAFAFGTLVLEPNLYHPFG